MKAELAPPEISKPRKGENSISEKNVLELRVVSYQDHRKFPWDVLFHTSRNVG